ncbi:MAG: UPF0149 family protein [Gammaproteobacteria bacterium]|nr:UPF0149 family protein [Gammaproteobacteria bacterium]
MPVPSFELVHNALQRAQSLSDTAECHGTLCGILCTGNGSLCDEWINQILEEQDEDNALVRECRTVLQALHDETQRVLAGPDLEFTPLLPTDDEPLITRVDALGLWCQGFLYGLSLGEVGSVDQLPPDVSEVINDFTEISRVGVSDEARQEEDEAAFTELLEYVRVGAQLVHDELNPVTPSQFRAPPGLH